MTITDTKPDNRRKFFAESNITFAETDGGGKQLTGLVVPWTGFARGYNINYEFLAGAFDQVIEKVNNGYKLPLQDSHEWFEAGFPVGLAAELRKTDEGLEGVFDMASTTKGLDGIELVKSGFCQGFSAGLTNMEFDDIGRNYEVVSYADIAHVTLLHNPAFAEADNVQVLRAGVLRKTPRLDRWLALTKGGKQ